MKSIADKFSRNMGLIQNAHKESTEKTRYYKTALLKMSQRYAAVLASHDPAILLDVVNMTSRNPHTQNDAAIQEIILPRIQFSQILTQHLVCATQNFAEIFQENRLPTRQWDELTYGAKMDRFASHAVTYMNLLDPDNALYKNHVNPNLILEEKLYFDEDKSYDRGVHYAGCDKTELTKSNRYDPLVSEQEGALIIVHEGFHRYTDGAAIGAGSSLSPFQLTSADIAIVRTMLSNSLYHKVETSYDKDPRERMARKLEGLFSDHISNLPPAKRLIYSGEPTSLGELLKMHLSL